MIKTSYVLAGLENCILRYLKKCFQISTSKKDYSSKTFWKLKKMLTKGYILPAVIPSASLSALIFTLNIELALSLSLLLIILNMKFFSPNLRSSDWLGLPGSKNPCLFKFQKTKSSA